MTTLLERLRTEMESAETAPEGVTRDELAEMLGTTPQAIQSTIRRLGVKAVGQMGESHTNIYSEEDARIVIHKVMSIRRRE